MKTTKDLVIQKLNSMNLELLEDYTTISKKYEMIDKDGYLYYATLDNILYNDNRPSIVSSHNKHSIENIKHYLTLNNLNCELLSDVYCGNKKMLEWKCACGNHFTRSWTHVHRGQCKCLECANKSVQNAKYKPKQWIMEKCIERGYLLIESSFEMLSKGFYVFSQEGYILHINRLTFINNTNPEKIHPLNPYSIYNINRFFDINNNGEYRCLSNEYCNNTAPLIIRHIKCGKEFRISWNEIVRAQRSGIGYCPDCYKGNNESYHAGVLKQVFMHEYPNTILEDRSCISPLTNAVLPTDIVNHELKLAIEIQSQYHDQEYQHKKDVIKKDYWLLKGYKFYDPDIREYSVIEMLQLFFPSIKSIPPYVVSNYTNTERYEKVQDMINSNKYTLQQIADKSNISVNTLYYWNKQNKIRLK